VESGGNSGVEEDLSGEKEREDTALSVLWFLRTSKPDFSVSPVTRLEE